VWSTPDVGHVFPGGKHWAINPVNVSGWYLHKFASEFGDEGTLNAIGPLDDDELFLLRLDLLRFKQRVATDPEEQRRLIEMAREDYGDEQVDEWELAGNRLLAALCATLYPGREDWGCLA